MTLADEISPEEVNRFWEAIGPVRLSELGKQFCLKWVRDYYAFCRLRRLDLEHPQSLIFYCDVMKRSGRFPFQIDQAQWSIRFFLREVYRPGEPSRESGGSDTRVFRNGSEDREAGIPPEWGAVIARLVDEVRLRHLSPRTLKAYSQWARAFAKAIGPLPPGAVTAGHAKEFLSGLARSGVSGATQNQAFSALRFLFVEVWRRGFEGLGDTPRAPGRVRFPDALTRDEALAVLRGMRPPWKLAAQVLYGCGLRLQEALTLRVQDIDFAGGLIRTYNAKGSRSRAVPLPRKLAPLLETHLRAVREGFEADLRAGFAGAFLQDGLERKMPRAALEWSWQWVFPAMRLTVSAGDGKLRRYHLHETGLQKEIRKAAARAGLAKRVSPHTFRHSFATEMLRMGYDIRTVQDLLGHSDVATTMIYTHVLAASSGRVVSPLDA